MGVGRKGRAGFPGNCCRNKSYICMHASDLYLILFGQ